MNMAEQWFFKIEGIINSLVREVDFLIAFTATFLLQFKENLAELLSRFEDLKN